LIKLLTKSHTIARGRPCISRDGYIDAIKQRLWGLYFLTKKKCFHAGSTFTQIYRDYQIETNGVAVSILLVAEDKGEEWPQNWFNKKGKIGFTYFPFY
jgi:hypothetical protein